MEQKEKGKKKKIVKNKKEEEKITEIFSGTVTNAQSNNNIDELAQYLWVNFDRTRLNDNWNDEIPQRQIKWTTHAEHILTEILNR